VFDTAYESAKSTKGVLRILLSALVFILSSGFVVDVVVVSKFQSRYRGSVYMLFSHVSPSFVEVENSFSE